MIVGPDREHKPSGYAYQVVSDIEGYDEQPVEYYRGSERGVEVVRHFLAAIESERERLMDLFEADEEIMMTAEEEKAFAEAEKCWLCSKSLNEDRVRDHCHLTGKFLGPAHNSCNLKRRTMRTKRVPVIFHNFKVCTFNLSYTHSLTWLSFRVTTLTSSSAS